MNALTKSVTIDLEQTSLRAFHASLRDLDDAACGARWRVENPRGRHAVAVGLDVPVAVAIEGHVGYYCAGMNALARITIDGNAGPGVAENMMSGEVRVRGDASQYAGASAHGGLLVIEGNAGARCGISMKGVDIVVGGSVGHMSAFMGQSGNLVICGDAGDSLGDSLYEARIFVRGRVGSLGSDCEEKIMRPEDVADLRALLDRAGLPVSCDAGAFRRYGSARRLYQFHVDNASSY